MAYEWDPARADRARKMKIASMLMFTLSALAIPAAILMAATPF